jgi:putative protease
VRDLGDVKYLLSPRDLAGTAAIPALAEIGVASLKIEGRQKGPQYVATAVAGYRKWRDSGDEAQLAEDLDAMALSYTRGQSAGFLGGVDHQTLVEGRFPKHRGVYFGRVAEVRADHVIVRVESERLAPRAGMGVVFDQGHPEVDEPGGPLFGAEDLGDGRWRLGFGRPGPDLRHVRVDDRVWISGDPQLAKVAERAVADGAAPEGRLEVSLEVRGTSGEPLRVRARCGGVMVEAESAIVLAAARGRGIDDALLTDKLGGFGGTPFRLAALDTSGLAPGMHLPVSELKEVRRRLVAALEPAVMVRPRTLASASVLDDVRARWTVAPGADTAPRVVPLVRYDHQLDAVLDLGVEEVELDWMELVGLGRAVERARKRGVRVGVATVRVQKPGEEKIDAHLARLEPDFVLVRSWGSLAWFAEQAQRPALHGDFSLNVTNAITAGYALGLGLDTVTAAHDLDAVQVQALLAAAPRHRVAVTVHHHIPTFHTEHCVYAHLLSEGRDFRTCGRPCESHEVSLRDRTGQVHPVRVDVGCRNTVFDAKAQSAAALVPALLGLGVRRLRVELVRESAAETVRVVSAYRALAAGASTPGEVARTLRVHEQFGVTAGTMRTLAVLP